MVKQHHPMVRVGLVCFLVLWGASWNPAQAGKSAQLPQVSGATGQTGQVSGVTGQVGGVTGQVGGVTGQTGQVSGATGQTGQVGGVSGQAPTVTTSLLVNGAAAPCGSVVASGAQVCLEFTPSQSGTAVVMIQKGTATSTLASGSVTAGTTYSTCVTAGTADGLTRTFTVVLTNTAGQSGSQQCSYIVAAVSGKTGQVGGATGQTGQTGQVGGATGTAPTVTTSLLVNGAAAACGTVVASGAQVCLEFTPSQTGSAVVMIQKGTSVATLASGSVTAGTTYSTCVTAGAADGLTRTFTVIVTNTAGQSGSQQCSYIVAAVSGKTGQVGGATGKTGQIGGATGQAPTVTTSLLVNGAAAACGAVVASGAQVCLEFTPSQSGTAVITIQKGTATSTLASGSVTAGTTYSTCVTAGAGDGLTRTFTVTVTNTAGQSATQQCSYIVAAVSGKTGQVGGATGKTGQVGGATGQAPTVTTSLLVNGAAAACGAVVASGAQVCLEFTPSQSGTAVITIQSGTATSTLASGSVTAGTTYSTCVTAGAADGLTRTFTVTVTNTAGQSATQQCSYIVAAVSGKTGQVGGATGKTGQVGGATGQTGQVGGQTGQTGQVGGATGTAPVITTSLLVNGAVTACGGAATSGSQVCLEFTSNQSGTAVITVQKGTATSTLANGAVTAGTTYSACVTAGTADGQTRMFTVTITSASGASSTQQCAYVVP